MSSTPSAYLGTAGFAGLLVGFVNSLVFLQQGYCWRNPDNDSNNMFTDVPCIAYDFPAWQGVLGAWGMYLFVASAAALVLAAVLFLREVVQGHH